MRAHIQGRIVGIVVHRHFSNHRSLLPKKAKDLKKKSSLQIVGHIYSFVGQHFFLGHIGTVPIVRGG